VQRTELEFTVVGSGRCRVGPPSTLGARVVRVVVGVGGVPPARHARPHRLIHRLVSCACEPRVRGEFRTLDKNRSIEDEPPKTKRRASPQSHPIPHHHPLLMSATASNTAASASAVSSVASSSPGVVMAAADVCSGCGQPAKQSCPTCIELKLKPTRFCSQECFKAAWKEHNTCVHKREDTPTHATPAAHTATSSAVAVAQFAHCALCSNRTHVECNTQSSLNPLS
jgi:hypothetical protein